MASGKYRILFETPDTPEWFEKRREGLGASDSAAVLGLSPWSTPLDVYRSKMGVDRDFDPMLSWIGHAQEPVIAKWLKSFHPEIGEITSGFAVQSSEWPWLFATPDQVCWELDYTAIPIELKTSSEFARENWANGVPLYYQVQVQQQIAVLGAPFGWLAVLHGGREFELFKVERDDEFIEQLVRLTGVWWASHVVAKVQPEPSTLGEIAEVYPSDVGTSVEASEVAFETVEQRSVLLADKKIIEEQLKPLELAIAAYMGAAETLTYQGRPVLTYKSQSGRRSVDLQTLEIDFPEVAQQVIKQGSSYKVFRAVKEKK